MLVGGGFVEQEYLQGAAAPNMVSEETPFS